MSATQKSLLALVLIAVGAAVFELHQGSQLREQMRSLREQRDASAEQMQQLQGELEEARGRLSAVQAQEPAPKLSQNTAELLNLRAEVARMRSEKPERTADPFTDAILRETARAARLNQQLALAPARRIPELQYLTLTDWLDAAKDADLESDAGVRKALSRLRRLAKNRLYPAWQRAFRSYLDDNGNQLPSELAQLKPYFDAPVDDTILSRYQLLVTGNASTLKAGDYIMSEKAPADEEYDERYEMGLGHDRWTHF